MKHGFIVEDNSLISKHANAKRKLNFFKLTIIKKRANFVLKYKTCCYVLNSRRVLKLL